MSAMGSPMDHKRYEDEAFHDDASTQPATAQQVEEARELAESLRDVAQTVWDMNDKAAVSSSTAIDAVADKVDSLATSLEQALERENLTVADMLVLMDQHASEEVKLEARLRFIERYGEQARTQPGLEPR